MRAATLTSQRPPGPVARPCWPGPHHPRRGHYREGDRLGL